MQVPIQDFKSHLSQYIGRAQAGETIELTSHRRVVARIIGVPKAENDGIARLLATGSASWQGGKPQGASLNMQTGGKPLSDMVLEDRG